MSIENYFLFLGETPEGGYEFAKLFAKMGIERTDFRQPSN